jgi:YidC/Oxa1 family membrane protein insertase
VTSAAMLFSILSPIEDVLRHILDWFHGIGLPWSWSIVALTVLVRMLLVPLTVKQIHSMQRLQEHMPQMKEIQKKYKGDRQRLNEEMMKFYRENQVNPASSCLPLVAQLPVFFALYFVLRSFSKHPPAGSLSWLGIVPDITDKASAHWSGFLLLAIYVASQMASMLLTPTTMTGAQRTIMVFLPLAFVVVVINFPVGLVLYWMTTNLWTVGQGLITRRLRTLPAPPPPAPKRSSRTPPGQEPDGGGNGAKVPKTPPPAPSTATASAAVPQNPRRVKRKKKKTRR